MSESHHFTLELVQEKDFEFRVKFDWPDVPDLLVDEPEPLGGNRGPNAARLIAAGVANCLCASLVFCLRNKFRQNPGPVRASVTGRIERNARGRFRIGNIDVTLTLADTAEGVKHFDRCLEQFEDFCIVTESIRTGIPVKVKVVDGAGRIVHESEGASAAVH